MCAGTRESGGKGRAPKGVVPVYCILGHIVKNCMTVIGYDGVLSKEEKIFSCRNL